MNYDSHAADDYWSLRNKRVDPLASVLNYGVPLYVNEAYSAWELACVLHAIPLKLSHVLDVACGNGRVTIPLARHHMRVTAVDNAAGMVEACRARVAEAKVADRVTVVQSSATTLPLADADVDAAVCIGLLEHLPTGPRLEVVLELIRVTRPGGTILLEANNEDSAFLKRRVEYRRDDQFQEGEMRGFFSGFVGRRWLTSVLEQQGLTVEIVGTNSFQAIALHLLRQLHPDVDDPAPWQQYFEAAAVLDVRYRQKGELDEKLADQFILKATKP